MNLEEVKETEIWRLYEKGRNYHHKTGIYADTDKNYRFYNGNQWYGAKLGDIEPVQKNVIKPIVRYKVSVIHDSLYAVNYSSQNFELKEFRKNAEKICEMLNLKANRIWEADKLDFKLREITKDAAINDEGIMYVRYDAEKQMPVNEIVKKNNIHYGNENDPEIQDQPYILIKKRMPVLNAIEMAIGEGLPKSKTDLIIGDNDTFENSGEASKIELDDMVTLIIKMWKEQGTVRFSMATRYVTIKENKNSGLTLYPLAHFNWEAREGSARGEGEVRNLIPNQIEINKVEARRVLTVKTQAFPQKVVNTDKVINPDSLSKVGGIIKTQNGATIEDVAKVVNTLPPATMSPDVKDLQDDLIELTQQLSGAGEAATGATDPEKASGRAILAVQQASQAPVTEQKQNFKACVEDLAKIWLDMLTVNSAEGLKLEEEIFDSMTGEERTEIVTVQQVSLEQLQAVVKIDVTPKGAYDRYAQEMSIENLFINGMFNIQKLPELKVYYDLLDDDSVMPKMKIEKAIESMENEQRKIAILEAQANMAKQRASQFINADPDAQAEMMFAAMQGGEIPVGDEELGNTIPEEDGEIPEEIAEQEAEMQEKEQKMIEESEAKEKEVK